MCRTLLSSFPSFLFFEEKKALNCVSTLFHLSRSVQLPLSGSLAKTHTLSLSLFLSRSLKKCPTLVAVTKKKREGQTRRHEEETSPS